MSGPAPTRRPRWHIHPRTGEWRWWSGHHWTQYRAPGPERPSLHPALSVPVVLSGTLLLLSGVLLRTDVLLLLAAATLPSLIVLAFLLFLDRVEPEPAEGRWHALLWGALVAGIVAGEINEAVAVTFGEPAAYLVAAPVGEELLKGAGLLWAVRRAEIDDVLDGAIYAGWVAVGFTIAEDFVYYAFAADDGMLVELVMTRSLGTFAHPLFTVWIGIAIGRAVEQRTSVTWGLVRGSAVAIPLHALWNLTTGFVLPFLAFVVLAAATVVSLRRYERAFRHDVTVAAQMIARASADSPLSPTSLRTLERTTDIDQVRALRARLPRRARRAMDAERTAIVRRMLHARSAGVIYPVEILEIEDRLDHIGRIVDEAGAG
jgi:RsiW-degrading membrane proteinase PrsW (M82 family)